MSDHPLDDLIDDVKARPIPYATVAAVGVAAAMLLAARAAQDERTSVQRALERVSHTVGDPLEAARQLSGSPAPPSGVARGTLAMVVGTLLSTGLAGWLKQRGGTAIGGTSDAEDQDPDDPLAEKTVAELRTIASERDISGRSTMNKDALVDALVKD